jgi:transglutaminase-like putative cysteine protease
LILRSFVATLIVLVAIAPAQERGQPRRPIAVPPAGQPAPVQTGVARRAGEFRIEMLIAPPTGTQVLELWIPAPRNDDSQTVTAASAPTPPRSTLTQQTDPVSGNTYIHVRIDNPLATVSFDASWTFERRDQAKSRFRRGASRELRTDEGGPFARDLSATSFVPVTGRMKARAFSIAPSEAEPLNAARAIYDEVVRSLEYSTAGEGSGKGDVLWAADAGHGDSTDFAALFVGLARARGIPARFLVGFRLPEGQPGSESEIQAASAWAEFLVPDLGWIPVDPADAKVRPENRQACFGNVDENRILFTVGRDLKLVPASKGDPHNFFIYPHAESDGVPVRVSSRFRFKEK